MPGGGVGTEPGSSECSVNASGHQMLARDSDVSMSSPASAKAQTSLCSHHEINGSHLAQESSTLAGSRRDPHAPHAGWVPALPMGRVLRRGCARERNKGLDGEPSRIPGFALVNVPLAQMLRAGPLKGAPVVITFTADHPE